MSSMRSPTQPRFIYTHEWRVGDLVIWDNRCTLHRATGYDVFRFKRDLRRTTINEYRAGDIVDRCAGRGAPI